MSKLSWSECSYDFSEVVGQHCARLDTVLQAIPTDARYFAVDPALLAAFPLVHPAVLKGQQVMLLNDSMSTAIAPAANVIFLAYERSLCFVVNYMNTVAAVKPSVAFHLVLVPGASPLTETLLQEHRVLARLATFDTWEMHAVFLDTDTISLNDPGALRAFAVEKDYRPLQAAADALLQLMRASGTFARVRAYGPYAVRMLGLFEALLGGGQAPSAAPAASAAAAAAAPPHSQESMFDRVVIVDRLVDPLAPALCPWTYESLLAEQLPYTLSKLTYPEGYDPAAAETRSIFLNTTLDAVFRQLRLAHISQVPQVAAAICEEYKALAGEKDRIMAENKTRLSMKRLREFVERQKHAERQAGSVDMHLGLAKLVQNGVSCELAERYLQTLGLFTEHRRGFDEYIRAEALRGAPLVSVAQLLTLYSNVVGGLKAKDYGELKRLLLCRYGADREPFLGRLERLGFIRLAEHVSHTAEQAHVAGLLGAAAAASGASGVSGSSGAAGAAGSSAAPGPAAPPALPGPAKQNSFLAGMTSFFSGGLLQKGWYKEVRNALSLVRPTTDFTRPTDISYVFNFYAPVVGRLVEREIGLMRADAGLAPPGKPPGRVPESWEGAATRELLLPGGAAAEPEVKPLLVVVLGGVTYAELAALNFLAETSFAAGDEKQSFDIVTMATSVESGGSILRNLCEFL